MSNKVLFSSKCWGGDWHKFLSGAFERKWKAIGHDFDDKWLLVNNSVPDNVRFEAKTINVAKQSKEALKYFKFPNANIYSVAELTALYLAKDFDYLCWVQGDCLTEGGDWVTPAIKILKENQDISVVSPLSQVNTWHDDNGLDQMFSDQGFVVRVKEFRKPIFNYLRPILNEFPKHGGESFERRSARYLHNNNKYRKVLNEFYLHHEAY